MSHGRGATDYTDYTDKCMGGSAARCTIDDPNGRRERGSLLPFGPSIAAEGPPVHYAD